MLKVLFTFWTLLAASVVLAMPPVGDILTLSQALDRGEVGTAFDLSATVTVKGPAANGLMVLQDGTGGLEFLKSQSLEALPILRAGDRVRVQGALANRKSYGLIPNCTQIDVVAHGDPPLPRTFLIKELQTNDCRKCLIEVGGTIVGVFPGEENDTRTFLILRGGDDTIFLATQQRASQQQLQDLTGAQVTAIGVFTTARDCRMIGKHLLLDSLDDIVIRSRNRPSPTNLAELTTRAVFNDKIMKTQTHASGTVLAVWGENNILLKTDEKLLVRGELNDRNPPPFGARIRLVGYPETDLCDIILVQAAWTPLPGEAAVPAKARKVRADPLQIGGREVSRQDYLNRHGHAMELTGIVRGLPVKGGDGKLYLESDGQMATVDVSATPAALADLEVGCTIAAAGTCVIDTEKMGFNRAYPRITGYRIVVRTPDDIRILARPPWWTPARLAIALGVLLAAVFGFVLWNLFLRRAVAQRSRELETEVTTRISSELKVYERTRLAVELHDTLSQYLTGIVLQLRTAGIVAKTNPDAVIPHLSLATKTVDSCREELRNCLWDLRNLTLDETDIDEAIRKTLAPHLESTDLAVRFNVPRERLSDNTAHVILSVIRELTVNAIRHGNATSVRIAGSIEDDKLLFSVRDDGCGFVPETAPGMAQGHFGLQGIRDRIKAFKGKLTIVSKPGRGTKATIALSIPASKEDASA